MKPFLAYRVNAGCINIAVYCFDTVFLVRYCKRESSICDARDYRQSR